MKINWTLVQLAALCTLLVPLRLSSNAPGGGLPTTVTVQDERDLVLSYARRKWEHLLHTDPDDPVGDLQNVFCPRAELVEVSSICGAKTEVHLYLVHVLDMIHSHITDVVAIDTKRNTWSVIDEEGINKLLGYSPRKCSSPEDLVVVANLMVRLEYMKSTKAQITTMCEQQSGGDRPCSAMDVQHENETLHLRARVRARQEYDGTWVWMKWHFQLSPAGEFRGVPVN